MSNAFSGTIFEKILRKKLGEKSPDFETYSAGWLGGKPSNFYAMEIKGAKFRTTKTGSRVRVPGTTKRVVIPTDEFRALVKKHK